MPETIHSAASFARSIGDSHLATIGYTVAQIDEFQANESQRKINQNASVYTIGIIGLGTIVVKITSKTAVVVSCDIPPAPVVDSISATPKILAIGDVVQVVDAPHSSNVDFAGRIGVIDRISDKHETPNPYHVRFDDSSRSIGYFGFDEIRIVVDPTSVVEAPADPINAHSVPPVTSRERKIAYAAIVKLSDSLGLMAPASINDARIECDSRNNDHATLIYYPGPDSPHWHPIIMRLHADYCMAYGIDPSRPPVWSLVFIRQLTSVLAMLARDRQND